MTFQPFDIKYSPHTDASLNPVTGVVTITVAFHPNNTGGYNCRVYELAPPYTGAPVLKRDWKQGENGIIGPFGHGASVVLPTGALLTVVPVGIDSAANVTPAIQIEPGYSAPFVLGNTQALAATVAALAQHLSDVESVMHETQNETARVRALAESIATGAGLSEDDRKALDGLKRLMGIT
jgi:hypothetical protein